MVLPRAGIRSARRRLLFGVAAVASSIGPVCPSAYQERDPSGLICRRHVQVRLPVRTGNAFIGDSATLNPSTSVACSVLNHLSFLGGYTKCKLAVPSRRKGGNRVAVEKCRGLERFLLVDLIWCWRDDDTGTA
jgi:hypothetical protein